MVDNYRQTHITLLDRSFNCTEGNTWIWNHVAQCLEHVHHVLGFASGLLAILLCGASFTSLSIVRARDHGNKRQIRLSAIMYWLSEVMSLFGAILSLQLPTQILYSTVMIPVYSLCCTYAFIKTSSKRNQKHYKVSGHSAVEITSRSGAPFETTHMESEIALPVYRLLGYILGIMAGILLGCVRVVEIIYVYNSFESHRCFPLAYLTGITGSACYIFSVSSQSMSRTFLYHASPWTFPRLVTIGMDFGILIQRLLQHRRTKQRRLSEEGARSLISSGTDDDSSGSESEEIIWMPLKIVETVQPQNSPNIQILTVSESSFDSQDIPRSFPDLTLVPGQASLPNQHSGDDSEAENVENGRTGGYQDEDDHDEPTEGILQQVCAQDNAISETSASSVESDNTSERSPLTVNNNCTKDSIATLGSVTTVEKIHSWISTSN